jgi:hypothetical protein
MIGAMTSGSAFAAAAIAAASASDLCFSNWRCFFCILFVVILTGAEPTLEGGGVFALEIEADVTEALSEIASLVGVPGRSCLGIEARLACLVGTDGGKTEVTDDGVALPAVGVSTLSALDGTSRNVLGVFRVRGDCTAEADGVLGGSGGKAEGATTDLTGVSATAVGFAAGLDGTEILRIPGCVLFSLLGAVGTLVARPGVVAITAFLVAGVTGGFTVIGLLEVGVAGIFAVPDVSAGKSSD